METDFFSFSFVIVLILHVETIQEKKHLFRNHSWTSKLVVIGQKIEICSIFYILRYDFFSCVPALKS